MSMLGMLLAWMFTTLFLKNTWNNYLWLVEQFKIGTTQTDANMFLRTLAYAVNHPIATVAF
jgi:hypothetical protein